MPPWHFGRESPATGGPWPESRRWRSSALGRGCGRAPTSFPIRRVPSPLLSSPSRSACHRSGCGPSSTTPSDWGTSGTAVPAAAHHANGARRGLRHRVPAPRPLRRPAGALILGRERRGGPGLAAWGPLFQGRAPWRGHHLGSVWRPRRLLSRPGGWPPTGSLRRGCRGGGGLHLRGIRGSWAQRWIGRGARCPGGLSKLEQDAEVEVSSRVGAGASTTALWLLLPHQPGTGQDLFWQWFCCQRPTGGWPTRGVAGPAPSPIGLRGHAPRSGLRAGRSRCVPRSSWSSGTGRSPLDWRSPQPASGQLGRKWASFPA